MKGIRIHEFFTGHAREHQTSLGTRDPLWTTRRKSSWRAPQERLRRGFRDNTWHLQTRGTDYELAPRASQRMPLVRTAYAEADGIALPDPDPANPKKKELAWMTVHRFTPDHPVAYPFKGWQSLQSHEQPSKVDPPPPRNAGCGRRRQAQEARRLLSGLIRFGDACPAPPTSWPTSPNSHSYRHAPGLRPRSRR